VTTITDDGGSSTVATGTATVEPPWSILPGDEASGGGSSTGGVNLSGDVLGSRNNDPQRAFLLPLGEATVDLNTGGLRLSHPLDFDQSPGTAAGGDPALLYNSSTVNVRPIIQCQLASTANGPLPTQAHRPNHRSAPSSCRAGRW
jgi:hypothetical protein